METLVLLFVLLGIVWVIGVCLSSTQSSSPQRVAQGTTDQNGDAEITYDWNGQTIHCNRWAGVYGRYDYTTRNRRHEFAFKIEKVGNEIRIYIIRSPSYGNRSVDAHSTHRYFDPSRGHYVCVRDDLKPDNVPEALSWMIYWAEQTGRYIDTGRSFA